ncbi:hypothetical protein L1887_32477 [Cichorium endivia]|nr:hypothetical protein L1887_32477 [Cichorium endivia]
MHQSCQTLSISLVFDAFFYGQSRRWENHSHMTFQTFSQALALNSRHSRQGSRPDRRRCCLSLLLFIVFAIISAVAASPFESFRFRTFYTTLLITEINGET